MTQAVGSAAPTLPAPIPVRDLAPWAVLASVVVLTLLYVVGLEQGATSVIPGELLHEFMHDGRHLLGFPCH